MKKLLAVIGVLTLVAALLGFADIRGSFGSPTLGFPSPTGAEQPTHRPGLNYPNPLDPVFTIHRWISFSSRSLVPGREHVRCIYMLQNIDQAIPGGFPVLELLCHPTADVSYFDPAWSYDGKYLAYVQANADGSGQALYAQEYGVSTDAVTASTPIGSPILVASGAVRRPNWHSSSNTLLYDSNVAGSSDIYTVDVDVVLGTVSPAVRRTFDNGKAELAGSWAPNGHEIAYSTNRFGPSVIEIIDLNLSSGDPGYTRLAEANFAFVPHNNPDWSCTGGEIYYDAPSNEDPSAVTSIWKLDLATQAKCEIELDQYADGDPDVDLNENHLSEGIPFNFFLFSSQGGFSPGTPNVVRGNPVNSCIGPLPLGVSISPATVNITQGQGSVEFTAEFSLPAESKDPNGDGIQDYIMRSANVGGEGIRLRSGVMASPTLMGLSCPPITGNGIGETECFETIDAGEPTITCHWSRRTIVRRIVALGLTNQVVPLRATMYSNRSGRRFSGFGYVKVSTNSLAGSSVLLLGNQPNPFNPATKIKFTVRRAGTYALRIYDVKSALVRTLANQHFDTGPHEAAWDGRSVTGAKAASGVYYAKISGSDANDTDTIRLVMAK